MHHQKQNKGSPFLFTAHIICAVRLVTQTFETHDGVVFVAEAPLCEEHEA